jgi:uncharacterized membrane-anchored protein YitT (DUF2179 family)
MPTSSPSGASRPIITSAPEAPPHTPQEDSAAIATAVLLIGLGVALFQQAGLLTGGITGLAFVLHYATGLSLGLWLFVLNLPFYWLALRKLGWAFTIKTFCAVGALSLLTELQAHWFTFDHLHPAYAAITAGVLVGVGMLILFRHRCSLGGFGIAALYVQERYGWRAGHVLMALDCLILASAFVLLEPDRALWSVLAAVVLNQVLSMNHRPGRYVVV